MRAPQFLKADPHGAVVEAGLSRNTPAQINGLELKLPARAELLQLREHISLQRVALMLEVRERRADEDPDDRPAAEFGLTIHRGQSPQTWFGQTLTWSSPTSAVAEAEADLSQRNLGEAGSANQSPEAGRHPCGNAREAREGRPRSCNVLRSTSRPISFGLLTNPEHLFRLARCIDAG